MKYEPVPSNEPMLASGYANEKTSLKNPDLQPMRLEQPSEPIWNDKAFAVIFIAHLVAIFYFAVGAYF